jgi:hypothetical protein
MAYLPSHPIVLSLVKKSMTGKKSVTTVWIDGHGPRIEGPSDLDSSSGQHWFNHIVEPAVDYFSQEAKKLGIRLRSNGFFSLMETSDGQTRFCLEMTLAFSLWPKPNREILQQLADSTGREWIFVPPPHESTRITHEESCWQALRAHVDLQHLGATLVPAAHTNTVRRL